METKKILKGILEKVKPTKKEKETGLMLKSINKLIKNNNLKAETMKGGSLAKGTHLKGDYDVDIFVRFEKKYSKKNLSKILGSALKPLKPTLIHGSRDYFHIKGEKVNYEIVPVLKIKKIEEAENTTDMSPMHVKWVKDNSNEEIRDDIRITKQFCKAIKVYGAESYIKGFSGHVIDILIIHYGGFLKLLKESSSWKEGTVIDPEDVHKGKAKWNLNRSKLISPIIVIDPIMPQRNASAALGIEKYEIFKKEAKKFLKKPTMEYFEIKKITTEDLIKKKKKEDILIFEVVMNNGKEDVVGSKILKVFEHIAIGIGKKGFKLIEKGWKWDKKTKGKLWYIVKKEKLKPEYEREGPPINNINAVEKFKEKHAKTYEKKGKMCTMIKRDYLLIRELSNKILKCQYIHERVKEIKCLKK